MYGLVMNEDECMVMVLKWDHGIEVMEWIYMVMN